MHGSTLYVEPDYFEEEPTARVDQPDTEPNKRGRSLLAEHLDSLDQAKKQSSSVQPEIDNSPKSSKKAIKLAGIDTEGIKGTIDEHIQALNKVQTVFDEAEQLIGLKDTERGKKLKSRLYDKFFDMSQIQQDRETALSRQERQKYDNLKYVVDQMNSDEFKNAMDLVKELLPEEKKKAGAESFADASNSSLATVQDQLTQAKTITDKMTDLISKTKDQTAEKKDFNTMSKILKKHFATLETIATSHPDLHQTMLSLHDWANETLQDVKNSYDQMQNTQTNDATTAVADTFENWIQRDPAHITTKVYGQGTQTPLERAVADNNDVMLESTVQAAVKQNVSVEDLVEPLKEQVQSLRAKGQTKEARALRAKIKEVTTMYDNLSI
tara:strand:+ start:241 stop:1386 length:1146 start_codon:yes stop_codon:yes gene_type:complete